MPEIQVHRAFDSRYVIGGRYLPFDDELQILIHTFGTRHDPVKQVRNISQEKRDQSNRLPVLEILKKYFSDWQVLLLTHDKVWAEIVRLQTESDAEWRHDELFLGTAQEGLDVPIHKPQGKGWNEFLARAQDHLNANDERAAAVYARAAFEGCLKKFCDKRHLPVPFSFEPPRPWLYNRH